MSEARPITKDVIEAVKTRFWGKVDIRSSAECWTWNGCKTKRGYGRINVGRTWWPAHRIALALVDRNPGPLLACHKCDNPPCVNPSHLFLGTTADNTADRLAKGRTLQRRGTLNPRSKLTPWRVRVIRASPLSQRKIAKRLGVSASTIRDVRLGRNWSCVQ